MAIKFGFFNAQQNSDGTYDRTYNATDMSEYFEGLISNGIYQNVGDAMRVKATTGMTVQVGDGRAIINNRWLRNTTEYDITLSNAHATLDRYTAIIIRLDTETRSISIVAKDGVASTNPVKPALVKTDSVYELCLAYIYVKKASTTITQSMITDTRADSNICGWVTGIIKQVDTSQLFNQFQTAYEEQLATMQAWQDELQTRFSTWFSTLTEKLQVNTTLKHYNLIRECDGLDTLTLSFGDYTLEQTDVLFITLNGIKLYEGTDYTLDYALGNINFTHTLTTGNTLEIEIIKSVIG